MNAFHPPAHLDVTDAHGGYTAITALGTLWRPPAVLSARRRPATAAPDQAGKPIGTLTAYRDSNYQGTPAIEATYRLPGRGPRAVVWFTHAGERLA